MALAKNIVEPSKIRYCRECGTQLVESLTGAENYEACGWGDYYKPYHNYDNKTGKRQYVRKYECPQKRFFNNHSSYMVDEIITF
jgi:hypothetical protein